MRVFLRPDPGLGIAITRVADALTKYAPPWVEIVPDRADAEFTIWHVLGAGQRTPIIEGMGTRRYAMIQYCLRTTEHPDAQDWVNLWRDAEVVWSYYRLPEVPHYYAPLGVDTSVFYDRQRPKRFLVGTSGYVAATEAVEEWATVCATFGYPQFHLGPGSALTDHRTLGAGTMIGNGMDDEVLAAIWSQCSYVAAMRRVEGFEFPGIEGLVCGARPVCFDQPWYRQWYGNSALYVRESSVDEVTQQLLDLVKAPYPRVTSKEKAWAQRMFNWERLVTGFWDQIPQRGKHR